MASSVPGRWVRTKSDEVAVDQGCYFDLAAADRVRYFFAKYLRHSKGEHAGQRFELLDWEWFDLIAPLFAWKMPDGLRRFRRAGCAVPKKNGKSTLLSGIGLYMLEADGEPGAEVYSAAADRDQAKIIYSEAANMVEASPALLKRLLVRRSKNTILAPLSQAVYKALSADVPTKEGLNIHCLLFDELHSQRTWDLWNALRYGGAARRQPIFLWITTAGVDRASLCWQQWQYAKQVIAGTIVDIDFLPVVYETAEGEDWQDEAVWARVNPSYGKTLSVRDFRADALDAKQTPSNENAFRRYRLNQWTHSLTSWVPQDRWDKCKAEFGLDDCLGESWLGLDLSTTTDLTALTLLSKVVGEDDEFLRWRLWTHFWCPEGALERRRRENRTRMDWWAQKGMLTVVPGDTIEYAYMREYVASLAHPQRKLRAIGMDPWNATELALDLQAENHEVVYVRTGFASISSGTKEFEKLVLSGKVEHAGHPVMDWMMANMVVEQDASGNVKPSKKRAAEKIDGPVSAIIALSVAVAAERRKRSRYEREGIDSV